MIKNKNNNLKRYFVSGLLLVSLVGTGAAANPALDKDKDDKEYLARLNFDQVNPVKIKVKKKEKVNLEVDKQSPQVFKEKKNRRIKIKPGLSNKQIKKRKQRKKAGQKARRKRQKQKRQKVKAAEIIVDRRTNFTKLYKRAGRRFGIDWQILAAVHSAETGQSGNTTIGSYAGARGPMQFIPSTWRSYAVDGDGNGMASIYDVDDAVHTAARYLAANGGRGNIRRALYHYNHAYWYVNRVVGIARGWGWRG